MSDKEEILGAIRELADRLTNVENQITELRSELKTETARWDERFFQLSKDTLTFVRSVITAGVIVAILVPAVKEIVPTIVQAFQR
jgi:hypothetical protein